METQQDREKLDVLLREANILRMRGQVAEAEAGCRRALEIDPQEPTALEMLGDLLRGQARLEEAAALYQRASAASPERPSSEKKYAEVTLELAEQQLERDRAAFQLQHPPSAQEQRRNVLLALVLSGFFPGLGQLYNREWVKGTVLAVASLILGWIGLTPLLQLFLSVSVPRHSAAVDNGTGISAWFGMLAGVLWLYSVIDAVVVAQKRGSGARAAR